MTISLVERAFQEFFSMTNAALKATAESLKDAEIPSPPEPKKKRQSLPPALRTPFDG